MKYIKYLSYNVALILLILSSQSAFAQYSVDSCDDYSSGTCTCYNDGFDNNCVYYPDNDYYGSSVGFGFYPYVYGNHFHRHDNDSFRGGGFHGGGFHGGGNFTHGGGGRHR